jgi:aldose 1-epimerase
VFKIKTIQTELENVIVLKDSISGTRARIIPSYGASIDELVINNTKVITNLKPLDYKKTYPSSILFPFANRINQGKYTYNGHNYNLECNENEASNALHGLVYNKPFTVEEEKQFENHTEIKLFYEELNPPIGYPFKFRIELRYKLTKESLSLKMNVINLDKKKLPFTLGWHPYFKSFDLCQSHIKFNSTKKIKCDKNNITINTEEFKSKMPLSLNKITFDDAFILEHPRIEFYTPEYDLVLTSSAKENYLQLYTPLNTNAIAIEPMTGVSDSFNNKIGLKELSPGKSYDIEWVVSVKLKTN